jgi:hypothetical protein
VATGFSRRDSIGGLAALVTALACASFGAEEPNRLPGALGDWLRDHPISRLPERAALCRLGALYLAAQPEERSRERLSRWLSDDRHDPIASRIARAVDRDWSDHDVAVVDGWILARTEARLCAVLHLEAGAAA